MEAVLRFQCRIERVSRDIEGVKAGHAGEGSGELLAEMFVSQKYIADFFGEDGCARVVWRALRQLKARLVRRGITFLAIVVKRSTDCHPV